MEPRGECFCGASPSELFIITGLRIVITQRKEKALKPVLLVLLAVILAPFARADTLTTTATVYVSVGCWDPAICGNPAAYWSGLGLNVPAVEPPADDFLTSGVLVFDWKNDPPSWFHDSSLGDRLPT